MKIKRCAAAACVLALWAAVARADEPLTAFVVIDDASVSTLGPFPLNRGVYARAISRAKELGARGVALKFLFDSPGEPKGDAALQAAVGTTPVLFQVFTAQDKADVDVSPKLARTDWDLGATPEPNRFSSVTYPLPGLVSGAVALGYIDARLEGIGQAVEVAGVVASRPISSLQVEIIELALGSRARVVANHLQIGGKELALDAKGRVPCDVLQGPGPRKIGIDQLLAGTVPEAQIKGKVVVLGYDRKDSPTIAVKGAQIPIHTLFYEQVACLSRLVTR
jgi:adenylate cyclase